MNNLELNTQKDIDKNSNNKINLKIKNITFKNENYVKNYGLNFNIHINNSILIHGFVKDENIVFFQKFVNSEIHEFETNNLTLKLHQDKFFIKTMLLTLEFNSNKILRKSLELFGKNLKNIKNDQNEKKESNKENKKINQEYIQNYFDKLDFSTLEKIIETDVQSKTLYFCNKNSIVNFDILTGFCASKNMQIKIFFNSNFGIQKEMIFYQKLRANEKVIPICNIIPISLSSYSFIALETENPEDFKFLQCFGYSLPEDIRKYLLKNCLKTNFYNSFGVLENIYYMNEQARFLSEIKGKKGEKIEKVAFDIITFNLNLDNTKNKEIEVILTNFQSNISKQDIHNLCQKFGKINETKTKEYYRIGFKNFEVSFYKVEDAHMLVNTYINCNFINKKLQKEYPKHVLIKQTLENTENEKIEEPLTRNIWYDYYQFYENRGVILLTRYNKKYISNIQQITDHNQHFEKLNLREKINYFKCVLKIPDNLIHFELKENRDQGILYISKKVSKKISKKINLLSIKLKIVKKSENLNELIEKYTLNS